MIWLFILTHDYNIQSLIPPCYNSLDHNQFISLCQNIFYLIVISSDHYKLITFKNIIYNFMTIRIAMSTTTKCFTHLIYEIFLQHFVLTEFLIASLWPWQPIRGSFTIQTFLKMDSITCWSLELFDYIYLKVENGIPI